MSLRFTNGMVNASLVAPEERRSAIIVHQNDGVDQKLTKSEYEQQYGTNHHDKGDKDGNTKRTYAAIYARTSSPNQKDNYSIEGQVSQCVEYCTQRGWKVSYIFVDEGLDAKTIDHRPKFQLMMKKATSKEFHVILGWKLDRLCRSLADLVNVERTLRNHGVQLCSVTELIDTSSSVGRFNFRSLASVAELEREMIGERSRLGLYALAREGKWPNGQPPIGYDKGSDGHLRINRTEARTVRRVFRMYLKLKSLDQVAFWLQSTGIATKRAGNNLWNARAVRDVLTNPIYVGRFAVAGHTEEIPSLRIIENHVFNRAGQLMRRYSDKNSKRPPMSLQRKQAKLHKLTKRYLEFLESFA